MVLVACNVGKYSVDRDEYEAERNKERLEKLLGYFLQVCSQFGTAPLQYMLPYAWNVYPFYVSIPTNVIEIKAKYLFFFN